MVSHNSKALAAPQPTKIFFDPYNSSSTGHQVHANQLSGSTAWRDSRTYKLAHQLGDRSGRGGDAHLADRVGAGSENFGKDGRKPNGQWRADAPGLLEPGCQDIRDVMCGSRKRSRSTSEVDEKCEKKRRVSPVERAVSRSTCETKPDPGAALQPQDRLDPEPNELPQIFRGLTIYLNGNTTPLVSDHKLKQMFASRGGQVSLALGRRSVTHIIMGNNAGGGLASSKIQKEVGNLRGKSLKFVTAQWVVDSVEKGVRQTEGKYMPPHLMNRIGGSRQSSVRPLFATENAKGDPTPG